MSENLRTYFRGLYAFDAVVRRVPAVAWDNPSPCDEWTAREVLGHATWVTANIAAAASGGTSPAQQPEAEVAGSDPLASWDAARAAATAALDSEGALQREMDSPFGRMAVDNGLGIFVSDIVMHTWDLATAAGIDHGIADDLAERVYTGLAAAGDAIRQPGVFGPAQSVPEGADPATRMAAMGGRRV